MQHNHSQSKSKEMQEIILSPHHVTDVRLIIGSSEVTTDHSFDIDAEPVYVPQLRPTLNRETAAYLIKEMAYEFLNISDLEQPYLESNVHQLVELVLNKV